jgi:hypothetical protein
MIGAGEVIMVRHTACAGVLALALGLAGTEGAAAATVYDGGWSLTFLTRRGACDSQYHFNVQITNGIVSHANLVKFRGRVSRGGAVRASVSVPGKFASGSGRLTRTDGRGRWAGHAGKSRCSGTWIARKY